MARKLRVIVAGGWYHVVNRGNRRAAIFRTDTDRRRFLGRLAELPERFRTEIHAFVLMDNHYHPWTAIVATAERTSGQRWSKAVVEHGSWIRDAVMYTAVRHLGYRLVEVYREIPRLKYPAAAAAVKRFERMQADDEKRESFVKALRRALKSKRLPVALGCSG